MSWEEFSVEKHKCPCGSGTYTIRFYDDDWGRTEEKWEMDCPKCKKEFVLYCYEYFDSGMICSEYLWVPKKLYDELKNTEKNLESEKDKVINIAHSRYIKKWLAYFKNAKSKKEIWRRLTNDGKKYPSLSTFYSHIKIFDLVEYLSKYFDYNNLLYVLKTLKIMDNEIDKKVQKVKKIEEKLNAMEERIIKEGYNR